MAPSKFVIKSVAGLLLVGALSGCQYHPQLKPLAHASLILSEGDEDQIRIQFEQLGCDRSCQSTLRTFNDSVVTEYFRLFEERPPATPLGSDRVGAIGPIAYENYALQAAPEGSPLGHTTYTAVISDGGKVVVRVPVECSFHYGNYEETIPEVRLNPNGRLLWAYDDADQALVEQAAQEGHSLPGVDTVECKILSFQL